MEAKGSSRKLNGAAARKIGCGAFQVQSLPQPKNALVSTIADPSPRKSDGHWCFHFSPQIAMTALTASQERNVPVKSEAASGILI